MASVSSYFQPKIGDLVNVESRTWPGINKPGGVGKVSKINLDGIFSVDVEYILGGNDRAVELEFVREHKFEEENNGRPSRRRRPTTNEDTSIAVSKEKKIAKKEKKMSNKKNALKDASSKANSKSSGQKRNLVSNVKSLESKKTKKSKTVRESRGTSSIKKVIKKKSQPGTKKENKEHKKVTPFTTSKKQDKKLAVVGKPKQSRDDKKVKVLQEPSRFETAHTAKGLSPSADSDSSSPPRMNGILKTVYTDMTKKAATFVQNVIGRKDDSQPSSPESTASSLDLKVEDERTAQFKAFFSSIMRLKMTESIEIDELRNEVNVLSAEEPFSELELRTMLDRLDKESKVMVTWDTGTVYCL